jgi:hypothetical protein
VDAPLVVGEAPAESVWLLDEQAVRAASPVATAAAMKAPLCRMAMCRLAIPCALRRAY